MRNRLLIAVVAILTASFALTSYISYEMTRSALKTSVINRELPLTGDNIYSKIQADLIRSILVSSQMANDTFLIDWVLAGEQDPEPLRRYLDKIRSEYGFFTTFFVSDHTLNYYHFNAPIKTLANTNEKDAWYFRVRTLPKSYEINVDPNSQQDDALTIFINHQVHDYEGNFIGATGVGLKLDTVAKIMKHYQNDFHRNVYFADQQGRITLHYDSAVAYNRQLAEIPGMASITKQIMKSEHGAFEYQNNEGTVLLTTRYIPELDWVLLVELPEAKATTGADKNLWVTLLIAVIAILITSILIVYAIRLYQQRLEQMATTDHLTGLSNRQVFDHSLKRAIEQSRRTKQSLCIIMLDVDHFKKINDQYGHLVGDETLKQVAVLLESQVRKADLLARWGGEEFILMMQNCEESIGIRKAQEIREKITSTQLLENYPDLLISASFGVAALQERDDIDSLLNRADQALYQAKALGRNRIVGQTELAAAMSSG